MLGIFTWNGHWIIFPSYKYQVKNQELLGGLVVLKIFVLCSNLAPSCAFEDVEDVKFADTKRTVPDGGKVPTVSTTLILGGELPT